MTTDITVYEDEISPISKQALSLYITDTESMAQGVTLLSTINKSLDRIVAEKEKVTKPLNEALKAERDRWKPMETVLSDAIDAVRSQMSTYQTNAAKLAKEQEEAIAARVAPGKGNLSMATAIKKMDAVEQPEAQVATDAGLVKFRTTQVLKITDETKIPRHYLTVNEKLLLEDLKKGVSVYGAEIEEKQVPVNFR